MTAPLLFHVGNRLPKITETITSGGSPVDLTGATVRFKMRPVGSSTLKVDAAATVTTPAAGAVEYAWASADVDTAGLFLAWWEVTSSSKTQDLNEALVEFRAHAQSATSLVELAEVRLALELDETDLDKDAEILELLEAASQAIALEVDRELLPTASATRRVASVDRYVDLSPYDLRTATTIVLDPDGAALTLVAGQDYKLLPVGGSRVGGTYLALELDRGLVLDSLEGSYRFGVVELSIAGAWGMAAVPEVVKAATIATVRSWLRRDVSTYAGYVEDTSGPVPAAPTYGIPAAARNLLRAVYRYGKAGVA